MFGLSRRRHDQFRREGLDEAARGRLERVEHYRRLDAGQRRELEGHARVLLEEKRFEGCGGVDMTDDIRVPIAGQAALLLMGRPTRCYPRLRTVLVYPREYVAHDREELDDGTVIEGPDVRLGESWGDAEVVVLAWDEVLAGLRHRAGGANVVLHEFAHQLDAETGTDDGCPLIADSDLAGRWAATFSRAFKVHCAAVERDAATVIDPYGAEHPAEFFAVTTEAFFMDALRFRDRHGDLYAVLCEYYHLNPATW